MLNKTRHNILDVPYSVQNNSGNRFNDTIILLMQPRIHFFSAGVASAHIQLGNLIFFACAVAQYDLAKLYSCLCFFHYPKEDFCISPCWNVVIIILTGEMFLDLDAILWYFCYVPYFVSSANLVIFGSSLLKSFINMLSSTRYKTAVVVLLDTSVHCIPMTN